MFDSNIQKKIRNCNSIAVRSIKVCCAPTVFPVCVGAYVCVCGGGGGGEGVGGGGSSHHWGGEVDFFSHPFFMAFLFSDLSACTRDGAHSLLSIFWGLAWLCVCVCASGGVIWSQHGFFVDDLVLD